MKNFYLLFLWAVVSCTQTNAPQKANKPLVVEYNKTENACDTLSVIVSETDTFDYEADGQYGVGDDDLFSYKDFYVIDKESSDTDFLERINDYNLLTAYTKATFRNQSDTLFIINDYSDYPKVYSDTAMIINEIMICNGNRNSLLTWKKSTKICDAAIYHSNICIGEFSLKKTYKMQTVNFGKNKFAIRYGVKDSIIFVIKSIYPSNELGGYSISEIKLEGEKIER
ncbi:MAG: hypothetical protein QM530_06840 [Phycisphaerales bacterium]|nr:hypothetical protein [Phycisphaerales bacterium]